MTTYNFTIRATDNTGAFADRAFNLTVNNTSIERFVAVGTGGLIHSRDGQNWTTEAGLDGSFVAYGNGNWAVIPSNTGQTGNDGTTWTFNLRSSPDAINWSTFPITLSKQAVSLSSNYQGQSAQYSPNTLSLIKYYNGMWHLFVYATNTIQPAGGTYQSALLEYTSTDLKNWTYRSAVASLVSYNSMSTLSASDATFDPISGNTVVSVASIYNNGGGTVVEWRAYYVALNSTAWAQSLSTSSLYGDTRSTLVCTNGLWCMTGPYANVWTSFNAKDWVERPVDSTGNGYVNGLTYSNGRLLTRLGFGSGTTNQFAASTNGGRSWTKLTAFTTSYPSVLNSIYRRAPLVSYAGTVVSLSENNQPRILTSNTDGDTATDLSNNGTNTSFNTATAVVGQLRAVAVRV